MTFERLTIGDAIAWVAALALLLCTAVDWYSTVGGNEARQIQHDVDPSSLQGALGGEVPRNIEQQAALAAQADEKNIWQEKRAYDRLELLVLLAAAVAAATAAVALGVLGFGASLAWRRERDGSAWKAAQAHPA